MPMESCRSSVILLLLNLLAFSVVVQCNPISSAGEEPTEEPSTTTTKSPEELQKEYEEFCKHRGPFCFEQTYVNIAITILGALVFLISACIAGCVSRRQERNNALERG